MSRKILVVSFCFVALVALAAWAPEAGAFPNAGSCAACHTFGNSSSTFHQGHLDLGLPEDCNTCHGSIGDNPVTSNCATCHVGPGVRAHHENSPNPLTNPNTCGTSTAGCHTGDPTPAPENTAVPGYAGLTLATLDPCDGSEERFTSLTMSLDNDGDLAYDSADSDCQAGGDPDIAVTPSSIDFGDVTVLTTSSAVEVTISNEGTADLELFDGVLDDTTNFILNLNGGTNPCTDTPPLIAPGGNCTVSVAFSPQDLGVVNATITVTSNDPDEGTVNFPLTGNGVAGATPDIAVTDSVAPADDLQVPFGNVTVSTSSDETVTVTNEGTADLTIGTVTSPAAPFSILNDTCSGQTLAPAASCTLTTRFSPNATSPFSDSFDIPSDDPDEDPVTVNVSGTGTGTPVPDVTVTDSVDPDNDLQVPFGDVRENSSPDQTVTVTNDGTADLVIGTVASANALAAPFSIPAGTDNCSDVTLAPSESCTITVQFAPTALGDANDTFDIPSNDSDEDPVTVTVSGTGVANNPPTAPALVLPADGATGVDPASVTFEWNRSTDPDGDPVEYDLFVCPDDDTFASCPDPVNTEPITTAATMGKGFTFAASGLGLMFFGIAFAAGFGRKKKVALLLALALATGMLFIACSDDDDTSSTRGQVTFTASNLDPATTHFWKVVATDGTDSTDSETRSFTTQ
jgi:hypothetical protein